jgi:hypothetical protein
MMSDLYRKQLQQLYDYCRNCLPSFAIAIRDADDEIERLEAWKDEHSRTEGGECPYCEIERLRVVAEAARDFINNPHSTRTAIRIFDALAALEKDDE